MIRPMQDRISVNEDQFLHEDIIPFYDSLSSMDGENWIRGATRYSALFSYNDSCCITGIICPTTNLPPLQNSNTKKITNPHCITNICKNFVRRFFFDSGFFVVGRSCTQRKNVLQKAMKEKIITNAHQKSVPFRCANFCIYAVSVVLVSNTCASSIFFPTVASNPTIRTKHVPYTSPCKKNILCVCCSFFML